MLMTCGGGEPPAFLKGATHAHSSGSFDAYDPPEVVAAYYAALGFDFLIITDHNVRTPAPDSDDIITIPGQEITGDVHYTEIGGVKTIINHPLWRGMLDKYGMLADSAVLFEVFNAAVPIETESAWDYCLSNGKLMYGVAASDSHTGELAGAAFVMVRAEGGIIDNLNAGDFYSSTGVYLSEYTPGDPYVMTVDYSRTGDGACRFDLIAAGAFVRGKITCTLADGTEVYAWGQPYA
jgi:hypothetical protein